MGRADFWAERRVFVTGATGMVGSWLVKDLLAQGANVVVLIRDANPSSELYRSGAIDDVAVVNGTVEDAATLERAILEYEVDTVFHLAAQTIVGVAQRSPLLTFEANIRGTYNLLEAARRHADLVARVVVASSDKAYGTEVVDAPYTEDMPVHGRYPYDVSKSCADMLAQAYHDTYGLPVTIARCGNIFGGGDLNWSRIVPGTIRSLLRGEPPLIRSDGRFVRDYIYVKDAISAYKILAERATDPEVRGHAFNFSNETPQTVVEVVEAIRDLMGRRDLEPSILGTARGEIRAQRLSATKSKRVLGWTARYDMLAGLRETIAWYRKALADSVRSPAELGA